MITTKYFDGFEGESFVDIYYIDNIKNLSVGFSVWSVYFKELLKICYNETNFKRKDGLLTIYKKWDNYYKYYDAPSISFKAIKIKNIKVAINEISNFNANLVEFGGDSILSLKEDLMNFLNFAYYNNKTLFFRLH